MATKAFRAIVAGKVQGVAFRWSTQQRAIGLGVFGWVKNLPGGEVEVHAEGEPEAVDALEAFVREGPEHSEVQAVALKAVKPEGHEQFAIRGVPAGRFTVTQGERGFALWLEVDGKQRGWGLPKGPSMDPAARRMAFPLDDDAAPDSGATEWDGGDYEQGGRVAWPEAIERGHAVFVLHGEALAGGFALQRTGGERWLLVKRKDDAARPGSDVVAERTA